MTVYWIGIANLSLVEHHPSVVIMAAITIVSLNIVSWLCCVAFEKDGNSAENEEL